jgi:ribosome-binding factor A
VSDTATKRPQRIAQLLHKELSALTVAGLRDPRIGLVTITEVRCTDDLKNAHVFVSVLGDERGLSAAAGFLRREITQRLDLRFAPTLHFTYDESLARAQRVDELLYAVHRGEHETPAPAPAAEMPAVSLDRTSPQPIEMPPAPAHPERSRKGRNTPRGRSSTAAGPKARKTRSAPSKKGR